MSKRKADYEFTIVVPLYNEVENIGELERRLGAFVSSCSLRTCVLFVNDGSTDGSLEKLADVCRHNPHFSYISFDRNYGLTAALKAGIDNTFSKYVGYIDADLQTEPEDFELLLRHIGEYSMVTGVRADRQDSFFKKMQSMIANSFRRMMTALCSTECTDSFPPLSFCRKGPATWKFPYIIIRGWQDAPNSAWATGSGDLLQTASPTAGCADGISNIQ